MRLLHSIEGTVAQQLAEDNALLAAGEEVLRFWESRETTVVLGRGNRAEDWVHADACVMDHVPVVRRDSGGGAVVLSAGCLNYSLVCSLERRPEWRNVAQSIEDILRPLSAALGTGFRKPGDLVIQERKVSGCAQRRNASCLLHHGTLLYDFDAGLAERYLKMPVRQPDYRKGRSHREFLSNLPFGAEEVRERVTVALAKFFEGE
jgi:lipoate-protein ligase A